MSSATIAVTAPDGRPVTVQHQSGNGTESLQRGPDLYTGVAGFEAATSGPYSVTVRSDRPGEVIVGRPVLAGLVPVLLWGIGALAGAACVALGLILLTLQYRHPG